MTVSVSENPTTKNLRKSSRQKEETVIDGINRLLSKRWSSTEDFISMYVYGISNQQQSDYMRDHGDGFDFIYMRPKDCKMTNKCIYDVEVIPSGQVNYDDYLTMSLEGISRFTKAGMCE